MKSINEGVKLTAGVRESLELVSEALLSRCDVPDPPPPALGNDRVSGGSGVIGVTGAEEPE